MTDYQALTTRAGTENVRLEVGPQTTGNIASSQGTCGQSNAKGIIIEVVTALVIEESILLPPEQEILRIAR